VAVRHSGVFLSAHRAGGPAHPPLTAADGGDPVAVKYGSSSLSSEESKKGFARFQRAMEVDRAFLRTDLTLDRLAEELGLARTYLSQVINEHCGRPFLEVVADYRVDQAQRILCDDKSSHLTVEAVGLRAGFQSKSAFYTAFRKRAGEAPAAYRRRFILTGEQPPRPHPQPEE
jgi:AraC-like DNA-binding protein